MKNFKVVLAAIAICAAILLPASLQAQPMMLIAGSSAMFNGMAYSAGLVNSGGYILCGTNTTAHYWSRSNGAAVHDSRNANITDEIGHVWIVWNNDAVTSGPNPKVCAYISIDSTVGVRAALAVPANTFTFVNSNCAGGNCVGSAGSGRIPNWGTEEPLPQAIYDALQGQPIQIGAADIRPEDAKFATVRALTAQGTRPANTSLFATGLGYGGAFGPFIGYPIKSYFSGAQATPVDFALYGNDPLSGSPAVAWFTANVGAGPVMIFGNTNNTATGHVGDPAYTNINLDTIAKVWDGTFHRTRDAFVANPARVGPDPEVGLNVWMREGLSGTMNTFEFNGPNTFSNFTTQEKGVTAVAPLPAADNPLHQTGTVNGTPYGRYRAVGTGDMVSAVKGMTDSVGYAFWGYGNFSSPSNLKYFTVNGIDPLYASPSGGVFPVKSGSTYPVLTFPNVVSGAYPIWTTFRLVYTPLAQKSVVDLLVSVAQQDQITQLISDYVAATKLQVFRSHYYQMQFGGANGHVYDSGSSQYFREFGGDINGQVFAIQADYDSITDTGKEITDQHE